METLMIPRFTSAVVFRYEADDIDGLQSFLAYAGLTISHVSRTSDGMAVLEFNQGEPVQVFPVGVTLVYDPETGRLFKSSPEMVGNFLKPVSQNTRQARSVSNGQLPDRDGSAGRGGEHVNDCGTL